MVTTTTKLPMVDVLVPVTNAVGVFRLLRPTLAVQRRLIRLMPPYLLHSQFLLRVPVSLLPASHTPHNNSLLRKSLSAHPRLLNSNIVR